MKKLIMYLSIIAVLLAGLYFLNFFADQSKYKQHEAAAQQLYEMHPKELHDLTLKQLDDPNYQNIILPNDLKQKIANQETFFVYFFSPDCSHCVRTTPELMPLVNDMNVEVNQFNLLEFREAAFEYPVTSTPTLIYFKEGKIADMMVGGVGDGNIPGHSIEDFKQFLEQS